MENSDSNKSLGAEKNDESVNSEQKEREKEIIIHHRSVVICP